MTSTLEYSTRHSVGWRKLAALAAFGLIAVACEAFPGDPQTYQDGPNGDVRSGGTGSVAIIGDSITNLAQVRTAMSAEFNDRPWAINLDATQGGETYGSRVNLAEESLGRYPLNPRPDLWDIEGSNPEAVVLNLGTNDMICIQVFCNWANPTHPQGDDYLASAIAQNVAVRSFPPETCVLATTIAIRSVSTGGSQAPVSPVAANNLTTTLQDAGKLDGIIDWKSMIDANWSSWAADGVGHLVPSSAAPAALAELTADRVDDVCGPRNVLAVDYQGSGPNSTWVHNLDAKSPSVAGRYQEENYALPTVRGRTTPSNYDFEVGDFNNDGWDDIYGIQYSNDGVVKVRVMDGKRGDVLTVGSDERFSTWDSHHVTPMSATDAATVDFEIGDHNWDGIDDLYVIRFDGRTAGGGGAAKVEVSVLNGATGFSTWLVQNTATQLAPTVSTAYDFEVGDFDGDQHDDVVGVKHNFQGTTGIRVLPRSTGYLTQTSTTTVLHVTSQAGWDFEVGDHDADGREDVYAMQYTGPSGGAEVHVIDAADPGQFLAHHQTPLGPTDAGSWTFMVQPSH